MGRFCRKCGKPVENDAIICPECSAINDQSTMKKQSKIKYIGIFVAVAFILLVISNLT